MMQITDEGVTAPPLSWRAWLLVPLTAVGLFGIGVPVWKYDVAPEPKVPPRIERERAGPRVPYAGELERIFESPKLNERARVEIERTHRRLLREVEASGGISQRDWDLVQRALARYR